MINLKKLITSIFLLSLLLSACGGAATPEPAPKGPYLLPTQFEYYYMLGGKHCRGTWINKARSGDANFAGFEIASELIGEPDVKPNQYGSDAMLTFHLFVKSITIENYLVDIKNQTVVFLGTPGSEPSQAIDPNSLLILANELVQTAPDIRVGILLSYNPSKFNTEEWVASGSTCDLTNTMIFTVPW